MRKLFVNKTLQKL